MPMTHGTSLGGRTALVTGASSGIGAGIARRLAADGCRVVINYARGARRASGLVREIHDDGGSAIAVQADVTARQEFAVLFDRAEEEFGSVDILVNNAGRAIRKPIAEFTDDEFDAVMNVNVRGVFNGMREAARRLTDGGRVVNISMSYQGAPIPGYGIYTASKAAVDQLTVVAARELGARQITVNALRPGPTRTPLFLDGKALAVVDRIEQSTIMGRLGEPDDIARVVAFLVSDAAGWITGQCVSANGGFW